MPFFSTDEQLNRQGLNLLEEVWEKYPEIQKDDIALTWVVYDPPVIVNTGGAVTPADFWQHSVRGFNYRGDVLIYPASLVKLFYLVALEEWLEGGMVNSSSEVDRAVHDMIVESSNDATSMIIDLLTGTTSGPELSPEPFRTWQFQRNIINRYYQSLGWEELTGINVNQKTWCDGAYGRERDFLGINLENRNKLTTNAISRLLHSIIGGVAVSATRSEKMMALLHRDLYEIKEIEVGEENQVTSFLGEGLPPHSRLWSKAGWTSRVRHDCAYIELPDHPTPFLLTVFTENHSKNRELFPFIAQKVVEKMG